MRNILTSALLALTLTTVGCGDDDAPSSATQSSGLFVGKTTLTNETSVAVVVSKSGEAAIYACDGVGASDWFFGTAKGNAIDATSEGGSKLTGTISGDSVTGSFTLAGAKADFTIARATGVAGLYLVQQSAAKATGFSGESGGKLDATLTANGASFSVAGTVQKDGASVPLTGNVKTFGEAEGVATWIVQADGDIKGRATKVTESTPTNTAGGGNCSVWTKIKSLWFGVDCSFLS